MIKIFKSEEAKVREISESYKIHNLLTRGDSESLSVVVGEAKNHSETTMNTASDRAYYIINGEIIIDGNTCHAGDVIYIPKNTEYHFEGTFEAIIVNSPAFDPKFDVTKLL